jgi:hypothetical protein
MFFRNLPKKSRNMSAGGIQNFTVCVFRLKQQEQCHKRISSKHYFPGWWCALRCERQPASLYSRYTHTIYQISECKNEMLAAAGERARQPGNEVHEWAHHGSAFSASIGQIEAR